MNVPDSGREERPDGVVNVEWGGNTLALAFFFVVDDGETHIACLVADEDMRESVVSILEAAAEGYRNENWKSILFDAGGGRTKRRKTDGRPSATDDIPF